MVQRFRIQGWPVYALGVSTLTLASAGKAPHGSISADITARAGSGTAEPHERGDGCSRGLGFSLLHIRSTRAEMAELHTTKLARSARTCQQQWKSSECGTSDATVKLRRCSFSEFPRTGKVSTKYTGVGVRGRRPQTLNNLHTQALGPKIRSL